MGRIKKGRPSRQKPTAIPGIYRFTDKETGSVDYIGQTNNLQRRRREHSNSGKYSPKTHHFEYQRVDGRSTSRTRRISEAAKIKQHQPRLNKHYR